MRVPATLSAAPGLYTELDQIIAWSSQQGSGKVT
jgi:hypothetical protein